jgi:MoxR-like ATPase
MSNWQIYSGKQIGAQALEDWLSDPPPWRAMTDVEEIELSFREPDPKAVRRGETYVSSGDDEVARINIALLLRRPLLVSGRPGLGKSSLAYHLAWALGLGAPLRWEVNSQTTLLDGLYSYDAVGHLRASQTNSFARIDEFITLGPVGTALLPTPRPRVLLIDELDKASRDLPNDLLHVLEEGAFTIPELVRLAQGGHVLPLDPASPDGRVPVTAGLVRTRHYPVVVITTNGERNFSEAFRRRCVELEIERPDDERMTALVRGHLGESAGDLAAAALRRYSEPTTDVLLQALFLERLGADPEVVRGVLAR